MLSWLGGPQLTHCMGTNPTSRCGKVRAKTVACINPGITGGDAAAPLLTAYICRRYMGVKPENIKKKKRYTYLYVY